MSEQETQAGRFEKELPDGTSEKPRFKWNVRNVENSTIDCLWKSKDPKGLVETASIALRLTSHEIALDDAGGSVNLYCSWSNEDSEEKEKKLPILVEKFASTVFGPGSPIAEPVVC
jgi:hypothetical protein